MKPLHLCLTSILLILSRPISAADPVVRLIPESVRRSPLMSGQFVFRGQDGVPLPADVSGGGVVSAGSIPAVPAQTFQSAPSTGPQYGLGTLTSPQPSTWNAFSPPLAADPFAGGLAPGPYAPYSPSGGIPGLSPYGGGSFSTPGANGPRPYRLGWHTDLDLEWMPGTGASGVVGNFEQFGVNYDLGYTGPFMPGWMMTWTNQFRLRNWDGPNSGAGLPGKAFRFGWDFGLETPQSGPVGISLGITPSINSDLHDSLGSSAFQLDGRGSFLFQIDQSWSLVLGAQYWDRVEDRVIPHVGLVYRDDYWEWRLMYPETTISLFLGNEAQWSKWMYMRAEYHVEAYEVRTSGGGSDQVELEDYRILLGFRMDAGTYSWFTEGGWVFDREVDFGNAANGGFKPSTGFIGRVGWRY